MNCEVLKGLCGHFQDYFRKLIDILKRIPQNNDLFLFTITPPVFSNYNYACLAANVLLMWIVNVFKFLSLFLGKIARN